MGQCHNMKKIYSTLFVMLIGLASQAQNWNGISGTWRPTTPSNISSYTNITFVQLLSAQQIKISNANNVHTVFNLKSISNGGAETILPFEVKQIYGYDAKKIFVRIYNQNNKLRVVRKIYEYNRNGTILNKATADSVLFEYVTLKQAGPNFNKTNVKIVDTRITPIGGFVDNFKDNKAFYGGTKYKIEFLSLNNLKGDEDFETEKDLEIIGGFKCFVRDVNKKQISSPKQIYFHSSPVGSPVLLQTNQPISLNNLTIDFTVSPGDFSKCALIFTGIFKELHRTKHHGDFLLTQGYYLRNNQELKTEEFDFSKALAGENMVEMDLRLERNGSGQPATIGVKIKIIKIN